MVQCEGIISLEKESSPKKTTESKSKRGYVVVEIEKRRQLVDLVEKEGMTIKEAAEKI